MVCFLLMLDVVLYGQNEMDREETKRHCENRIPWTTLANRHDVRRRWPLSPHDPNFRP
jgi:hypothetical protein